MASGIKHPRSEKPHLELHPATNHNQVQITWRSDSFANPFTHFLIRQTALEGSIYGKVSSQLRHIEKNASGLSEHQEFTENT